MDTIKTGIKRAVCSLPFLISIAIMVLAVIFGAGKDMIFPQDIKRGLFPYYHMEIIFRVLQADIVLIVVPIICTLPYTAAFLDEHTSWKIWNEI